MSFNRDRSYHLKLFSNEEKKTVPCQEYFTDLLISSRMKIKKSYAMNESELQQTQQIYSQHRKITDKHMLTEQNKSQRKTIICSNNFTNQFGIMKSEKFKSISPMKADLTFQLTNMTNHLQSYSKILQSRAQQEKIKHQRYINIPKLDVKAQTVIKISNNLKLSVSVKSLDQIFAQKLNIYFDFLNTINLSNNIIVNHQDCFTPYKAAITRANNGILVRNCLKQRWWWTLAEKGDPKEKINLVWSSWRKVKFIKLLKSSTSKLQGTVFNNQLSNRQVKWKHMNQLLSQNQINEVYDYQQTYNQKMFNSTDGPFIFENCESKNKCRSIFPDVEFPQFSADWKIHNHFEKISHLHSKKNLLRNLNIYYNAIGKNPFEFIPLTFHIDNDKDYYDFREVYLKTKQDSKNIWIVKPGENSNRGRGIQICSSLLEIQTAINSKEYHKNGSRYTHIVQKYIEDPLLFNKRKFDIRCYMLLTSVDGKIKGYWYKDGYIRTSSVEYSLRNLDNRLIHLTNDAIQKKSEEYGKFESGNKVQSTHKIRYLELQDIDFQRDLFPLMKNISLDSIKSVFHKIDPFRRINTFELLGLDFMLDRDYKPWLIEINANPCLETSCSILNRVIPALIENVWKIAIDPLYPPPDEWPKTKRFLLPDNIYNQNKFELIFDEQTEGPYLLQLLNLNSDKGNDFTYGLSEDEDD